MKKITGFILASVLLLTVMCGCSPEKEKTAAQSDTAISTTTTTAVTTETTDESTAESTAAQTTHVPSTARSTAHGASRSAASTQRKRQQDHKTTVSTTQKTTTTTKKSTTTAPYWCTDGGSHHVINVGTIGWYSSYSEAEKAAKAYIADNDNVRGYEVRECACGMFTANFTYYDTTQHTHTWND